MEIANDDLGVLDSLKAFLKSLGIYHIYSKPWNKGRYYKICNRTFALILHHLFDFQYGAKFKVIRMPALLGNSPLPVIAAAVRGAFDGDGFVVSRTNRIGIQCKSKKYIQDIHDLLLLFGIQSYVRESNKDDRYVCEITRYHNVKKFSELIGFNNAKRKKNLQQILLRLEKRPTYSHLEIDELVLSKVRKHGQITSFILAKEVNRSVDESRYYLRKLYRRGILERQKEGRLYNYGLTELKHFNTQ